MNKLWRLFFILCVACLSHSFGGEAAACSCRFGGGAPCEEYWRADAVFSGRVVGSSQITVGEGEDKHPERLVRLTVESSFRGGVEGAETEVITGWGGGDCGYEFKMGGRYLVYAYRGEQDQKLYTSICSRTRQLSEAADDLTFIREVANSTDTTGSIFGRVVKRNYQWKEGEDVFKPIANAELVLEGQGKRVEMRSDAEGRFRFASLKPGPYKVRLKIPEGLTDESLDDESRRTVEGDASVTARGCDETAFYLESDTRVTGRVLDATGQPVPNLRLEMRPAPNNRNNYNSLRFAQTDAEGRFSFKTVPPGSYLLGFRIISSQSNEETLPFPRAYYPGVPTRELAGVVRVEEGEQLKGLEFRLPPRLTEVNLEGVVVWEDGRPAAGASVNVSLLEEGEMTTYRYVKADERGRFTFKAFDGATYRVSATAQTSAGQTAMAKWVDFQAAPDTKPLRLVVAPEAEKPKSP
jgi:5-hydroxyisourate hydrolase-like protein (transthyretin family)